MNLHYFQFINYSIIYIESEFKIRIFFSFRYISNQDNGSEFNMMNHTEKMTDLLKEKDILNALQNMADLCESHMLPLVIFRKRDSPMMKFNFCTPTHFVMKKRKKKYLHSIYIYFFLSIFWDFLKA